MIVYIVMCNSGLKKEQMSFRFSKNFPRLRVIEAIPLKTIKAFYKNCWLEISHEKNGETMHLKFQPVNDLTEGICAIRSLVNSLTMNTWTLRRVGLICPGFKFVLRK